MADYTTIRQDILNRITENGEGEITGLDLQGILLDMIDTTSVDINQMKQRLDDFFAASNLNDVIDNWTELEAFLAGLTDTSTLVELLSYKADKVDVYTKTEADALFEFKANLKALAYKDSVSMGDISGLTDALALKLDKSGGTITGDLGVDGILTMGTLRLPNASGVSGNFDLYVGSLGSGSDIPEGGGGTISYVAIKFAGENTPYEIDANGVITLPAYPDISHLATKVELTEGLATKQDVISDLATIRAGAAAGAAAATPGYVDQKIADLIGSAPETLDTLQELAEALQNDAEVIDAINASIQQKANQSDLTALATRVGTAEGAITTLQGYFFNGVAKKATADADGNVITSTYYRKDGGTIGGNAYVQGELTMNTLFLPNSSNVPSAYSLYVGSLGSGSDVPSSGGDGDTVVFTPIDSNYGTLSINGTQVGALSLNGHTHSQYQLQITSANKLAYSLISGTPNLGSLAYKNSLVASDIPDLSGTYLPLSGGTIESTSYYPLTLDTTQTINNGILFNFNKVTKTQIGWSANLGTFLLNYGSDCVLGIKDDGTPYYMNQSDWVYRTLIHEGNIGSQSVSFASSAGSATRLQTARTIWGQSFDGTGNVDGAITLTTNDQINGALGLALNFLSGSAVDTTVWDGQANRIASFKANGNVLIGTTTDLGQKLQVSGRSAFYTSHSSASIGVENQTLVLGCTAGSMTGYSVGLSFNGLYTTYNSAYANQSHAWIGLGPNISTLGIELYPLVFAVSTSTAIGSTPIERMRIMPSGNVGIGTIDPQYELDVNGTICASSAYQLSFNGGTCGLYANGRISSGGDANALWLYNWSQLALYGSEILLRNNTSVNGNISASGYQLPTSAPSNPVSGGYYLYVGSLGAGVTIS